MSLSPEVGPVNAPDGRKITEVAVGVLIRPDGAVLLGDRPAGKPYAGYWEFPGGKVEPGETVEQALARELHEELGIDIGPALPWFVFEYDYPHAYVRLHFRRVYYWSGTPHAREGQRLEFFRLDAPAPQPLLPAAIPALRWLDLPPLYALSAIGTLGIEPFLAKLEARLARGLRLLQVREPNLSDSELVRVLPRILERCQAHGARVLLSSRHGARLRSGCDGVHLTAEDLKRSEERPSVAWVSASVHDPEELRRAATLGCDFVVAGPVLPTASHPGQPTLGWHGFAQLARANALPMYAIGGLADQDLDRAQHAGAHGVALLSAAWA